MPECVSNPGSTQCVCSLPRVQAAKPMRCIGLARSGTRVLSDLAERRLLRIEPALIEGRYMEAFELRIPPDMSELRPMRDALGSWLDGLDSGEEMRAAVVLAAHEAAANAIEYAGP